MSAGKSTAYPPSDKTDVEMNRGDSFVGQRESVFDDDEFDVFRRPEKIDFSRVQIGKK